MASASDPSSSQPQGCAGTTPPRFYEAAHAALNTNELLCEVVGRLPLKDIVATTGVCRTWRNALKASVAIQQAMFLVPAEPREIATTTKCLSMRVKDIPRKHYAIVGEPNPYTTRIISLISPSTVPWWDRLYEKLNAPMRVREHSAGTWREMFITQPPIKAIELSLFVIDIPFYKRKIGYASDYRYRVPYNCDEGIKLGPLYDFITSTSEATDKSVVVTMIVPDGFFPEHSCSVRGRYNRWWEIRKGKVHRRIQPPNNLIDLTGDVTDTEDQPMSVWWNTTCKLKSYTTSASP